MDFTLTKYRQLLHTLQQQGFSFQTFAEFLERPTQPLAPEGVGLPLEPVPSNREKCESLRVGSSPLGDRGLPAGQAGVRAGERSPKTIILRHDVDLLPQNSLRFAQIQNELGIKGSYYFRAVPESWDEAVIKEITALGHEVGYHYEDLSLAANSLQVRSRKNVVSSKSKEETEAQVLKEGIRLFETHLEALRKLVPVKTICMHGSPRSNWDSKDLWKHYNYRDYGIIGEPYFDVDFDEVFYLTDTGRRWDGWKVSIRDKVPQQDRWKEQGLVFHSTQDIIHAAKAGKLPDQIMMTFHPQRWHKSPLPWLKEFVLQNTKNVVKYFLNNVR